MKTITLLSLFILLFQLSACNDDQDNAIPAPTATKLAGTWNLVNVSGGMMPQNHDFEEGLITWTFNGDQTVTVLNNNTDDSKTDYFDSGIYPYDYLVTNDLEQSGQEIIINNQSMGETILLPNQLTMSQAPYDGLTIKLIR